MIEGEHFEFRSFDGYSQQTPYVSWDGLLNYIKVHNEHSSHKIELGDREWTAIKGFFPDQPQDVEIAKTCLTEPDPIWWTADEAAKEFGYKNAGSFRTAIQVSFKFWQQNRPKMESGEWYRHEKGGKCYYHYECILAFAEARKAAQEKERSAIAKGGSSNVINLSDYRPAFEAIAQSQDRFPVDFDQAWQWIGYSTKGNARRKLEADFVEGLDYLLINIDKQHESGTKYVHQIMLTVPCFREFCMMAGTEQGKKVRLYYLEVEDRYKKLVEQGGEAMPSQLAAVNQRLEAIEQDVSEIKENVVYVRDHIDRKSKLERENFKHEVKRRVCYLLHKFNNGRCLITGDRILNGANWLDNCDFHHIDGNRNKSKVDNCCPLSRNGHKLYHEDSANPEYNEAIAAWRYWLKQQTEPPQQTTLL